MYQGKNLEIIGIPEEIKSLSSMQKTVANAVMQSGIGNDPHGMRLLFMDNRYTATPLFIILKELFDILCAGTTRKNRIAMTKQTKFLSSSGRTPMLYHVHQHSEFQD